MKKILCILLLLSLLSACGTTAPEPSTEAPTETSTQAPTEAPTQPEPTEPEPPDPIDFDALYSALPGTSLYEIPALAMEADCFYGNIVTNGRYIAARQGVYDEATATDSSTLYIFSLADNAMTAAIALGEDSGGVLMLPDGSVCFGSSAQSALLVYDTSGTLLHTYSGFTSSYNLFADGEGRIWVVEGNTLHCLFNGEDTTYDIPLFGSYPAVAGVEGDVLYLTYTAAVDEVMTYNTKTGEAVRCELLDQLYANGSMLVRAFDGSLRYAVGAEAYESIQWSGDAFATLATAEGFLYAADGADIYRYDTEKKTVIHAETGTTGAPCAIGAADEIAAVMTTGDNGYRVFVWTGAVEAAEDFSVQRVELTAAQRDNLALAAKLFEEYGVCIRAVPLEAGTEIGGYEIVPPESDAQITEFINLLSGMLARYPQGYFRTLTSENLDAIELLCASGLPPAQSDSIASAAAFTAGAGNSIYVVFDMSYSDSIEGTLAHELLHVMEDTVNLRSIDGPRAFPDWDSLNPPDFTYYETYVDDEGYDIGTGELTWSDEYDNENIWFVDTYSKTYGKEDRARVFENLFMNNDWYFESPHLYAKAEHLCAMLREYFPEWYADGAPVWEAALTQ